MIPKEKQQTLSKEFGLSPNALKEIASARAIDDRHANGFGGVNVYQASPISKHDIYAKHGLTFEQGEQAAWAWIYEESNHIQYGGSK